MRIIDILSSKKLPESTTERLDLELLLMAGLKVSKSFIYTDSTYELTTEQETIFQKLYRRRLQGEPMAYILGHKEFWSLDLMVNDKVLIPRPATEKLVEVVLQLDYVHANVVDLGTGSGAIALALAKERPLWQITATDISDDALQIARANSLRLQLTQIEFYRDSWCEGLPDNRFDIIVSNPPYIDSSDPHLECGDVNFEPKLALVGGEDGLQALREIIVAAQAKLKVGGVLVLEHGYNQKEAVQNLLHQHHYRRITCHQDLAGMWRVVIAIK